MLSRIAILLGLWCVAAGILLATVLATLRGIVHDPQHRPIASAEVVLKAVNSEFTKTTASDVNGDFAFDSIPVGEYTITATKAGFDAQERKLTVLSGTAPILHFELPVAKATQSVTVTSEAPPAQTETVTPTTLATRQDIALTPGANLTNSFNMITDLVPGSYVTHDQLHIRGGHQTSWLIDGVQIPNTNIGSNLGAQIDPKDIDYLEVQRGSYNADVGDRTYGVFNVVPRTGFAGDNQGELVLSAGNFYQTNDQLNLGSHSERFAYYASLNGNRSNYGLQPPISRAYHDAVNGYGGFASLIYNRTPRDQFRIVTQLRADYFQVPYDPDPNSPENQVYNSSGLRDGQHETDGLATLSWVHTFNTSTLLQISPFYHYNSANYEPKPYDFPVATTSKRASSYGGLQGSFTTEVAHNTIQGGVYTFGQHDSYLFGSVFNDGSFPDFSTPDAATGGLMEEFLSDNYKVTPWLTLIVGVRQSWFRGNFTEKATSPRVGAAVQIPKLNWVFRGFYGHYYQPPPLLTATGPILRYANATNTTFEPLHGERDEEHQFGVQIPFRGWLLDADTFRTRANNFLDHSNVGESSLYYPVTIDGALIRGWELTLRSPRLWRYGQAHLAYSNQIAEQRGAITGGLICAPVNSPDCSADFSYSPLDHDQRNTLNAGFDATLPWRIFASTNIYYGSGFVNGDPNEQYPDDYLPQHTTFDLSLGKTFGENVTVSVTSLNVANRRVLLDNSLTFGGFHYNDPRQIYAEVRYRFHY